MRRDEFWTLVDQARAGVADTRTADGVQEVAERLVRRLAELGPAAAVEFDLAFDEVDGEAYRWDLWAAAYLMQGGCSDDGFDYFRGWLAAQGRQTWERVLADPDSLADVGVDPDDDDLDGEAMLDVGADAYGDEDAFGEALEAARGDADDDDGDPAGESFDFDDDREMRARLPRLAAIHLPE